MRDPSGELSVRPGSNSGGLLEQSGGSKPRENPDLVGGAIAWAVTSVNVEQASKVKMRRRASNEQAKADAGVGLKPNGPLPAAGVMTTARAKGSLRNVRDPIDRSFGSERREGVGSVGSRTGS